MSWTMREEEIANNPLLLCIIIQLLMEDQGLDEFMVSDIELVNGECKLEAHRAYDKAATYIRRKS